MEKHMHTLTATKPNSTTSNVSTPVGEACQWAYSEILRLREKCGEVGK